jgi:hypothetical protein
MKKHGMKSKHTLLRSLLLSLLVSFMLMMPLALPAASKNWDKVTFDRMVIVDGTHIPPGGYRVQWEGTGSSVRVSVMHGKEAIATSATLIQEQSPYDTAVELTDRNIVRSIVWRDQTIRFDQVNASSSTSVSGTSR